MHTLFFCLALTGMAATPALPDLVRAGYPAAEPHPLLEGTTAKAVQVSTEGTRGAIVLFSKFRGELPEESAAPTWAQGIFDPELPGSFSHFCDTMSFGKLRVRGEVGARRYASNQVAATYLSSDPGGGGDLGRFSKEILLQADVDIDFSRFDNDGQDGIANSGDDDGLVDVVFIVLASTPPDFLFRVATGISHLGLEEDFTTNDIGAGGGPIRIPRAHGTIQRGSTFAEAVGHMCHEFGHHLGLPELFNTEYFSEEGANPARDSAGIGNWGLMGWGASGWHGDDGPNSFCAFSRMRLDPDRHGGACPLP